MLDLYNTLKFKFLLGVVVFSLISQATAALAPVRAETPSRLNETPKVRELTVNELIEDYGILYKVSTSSMHKIVSCESRYNPSAVNDNRPVEYSVGLSQINLLAHPNVTKAQALDPRFAIEFLAKNIAKGKGNAWTCFRNLGKMG